MVNILYGALALIVLLVVTALVLPNVMNWDSYKPEISEHVKALTGRSLAIDGDIDIDILPTPKLRISDVRPPGQGFQSITKGISARLRARLIAVASSRCFLADTAVIRLGTIFPLSDVNR